MKAPTKSKVRERKIYRHPLEMFKAPRAARRISALPKLSGNFKVPIPSDEDFVVRHRAGTAKVRFLRGRDGRMTAFADSPFEIELIGTNAERYARAVAAGGKNSKPKSERR